MRLIRNTVAIVGIIGTLGVSVGTGCGPQSFMAFHKTATKQRARGAGAAADSPPKRRSPTRSRSLGKRTYFYTNAQLHRLRRAGYQVDELDFNIAHQLHRRGYSAAELVRAYEDVKRHAGGDRSQVPAMAAFRLAGFDLRQFQKYRSSHRSLTGYYNRRFAKGTAVLTAGWVLTVVGLSLVTLGSGLLISGEVSALRCERGPEDEMNSCRDLAHELGVLLFASVACLGGLSAMVGGVLVLATFRQPHRHLYTSVLDSANAATLRDFHRWRRLVDGKPPAATLSLSPLVTRGGGGLVLRLKF